MVALLWQEGQRGAAIQLERLWNDLAHQLPFSLLCAYPLAGFRDEADSEVFLTVCREHSQVTPAESYTLLSSTAERQLAITQLQQKASALEVETAERKHAQQTLERSQRELADFFENAVVGLHWVGPDGIIQRANRAELNLLGYTAEEYIGRRIADFHVDQPVIDDMLQQAAARRDPHRLRGAAAVQGWNDQKRADRFQCSL